MRQIVTLLLFCLTLSASSQNIEMKKNMDDRATKTLLFETPSFSGKMKSTNSHITVNFKNNSSRHRSITQTNTTLKDISGRGVTLCSTVQSIAPGASLKIRLTNCSIHSKKGVFGLQKKYSKKSTFSEESLYLVNKKWILNLAGEKIVFYTN